MKKIRFNILIPPALKKSFQKKSGKEYKTMTAKVIELMEKYVGKG